MGSRINYYSLGERLKLGSTLGDVVAYYGNPKGSREAIQATINALETALEKNPNEWVFWYVIGEYYMVNEEFAKCVQATRKCFELKPKDLRSIYAMATVYYTITHAKDVGDTERIEVAKELKRMSPDWAYNPEKSQEALDEIGLTAEQAAIKAITLLEILLGEKLPSEDKKNIQFSLEGLRAKFTNLG